MSHWRAQFKLPIDETAQHVVIWSMTDPVFIHPQALVESEDIGAGTRVWAFAHVMKGAQVGKGTNIGDHSFIESGAIVGNDCTIKNGVSIWDGVEIGDLVFVGPERCLYERYTAA